MKPISLSLPLTLCLALPVFAEEGPSFDCAAASSSAEELICEDAELARLDRLVAERYAASLEAAQSLETGAEEAEQFLRAYQRGWIGGRDECWKAGDDIRACVEEAYLRREGELVAFWMLEEPTGTTIWACDGNPANEVVTTFFATELPSVRIERGDSVTTASLVPTGSGSRYEGDFGQYIWISGEEATYREPDPDGTEYTCEVSSTM